VIPAKAWIHLKLEVSGTQARVYLNNAEQPGLVVHELKHGVSTGSIGIFSQKDRNAIFSNFQYRADNSLTFPPPPAPAAPPGILSEWRLSQPFPAGGVDMELSPDAQGLTDIRWQTVRSEPSGLVDIARYHKRTGREPDCVIAKTTITAEEAGVKKLLFGYSDLVSLFVNGRLLFMGNSAYRQRDPSFLGAVGLHDAVYLPVKKGENELLLMIMESFGGWGFICQDGRAVYQDPGLRSSWKTGAVFSVPESVTYDTARQVLYVSNFDAYNMGPGGRQFISKVALNGQVEALKWVTGLNNPTGLDVYKDKLYVAERGNLVEIATETGAILNRYPAPGSVFLNDVAVDASGGIYLSDSGKHVIYKFAGGAFEEWLKGSEILRPNGLHVHGGRLIVGNNGDNAVKAVNLSDKKIVTLARLGPGTIDGIKADRAGHFLVSHWEGKIYRLTPAGEVTRILDTTVPEINNADFEYVEDKNLIVIPTFLSNTLMAYEITD
jgi:sugar lactone lactonase YvrE